MHHLYETAIRKYNEASALLARHELGPEGYSHMINWILQDLNDHVGEHYLYYIIRAEDQRPIEVYAHEEDAARRIPREYSDYFYIEPVVVGEITGAILANLVATANGKQIIV